MIVIVWSIQYSSSLCRHKVMAKENSCHLRQHVNKSLFFFTPTIYSAIYSTEILSVTDTGLPFDLEFPSKAEQSVIRRAIEMSANMCKLVKLFPQCICGRSEVPLFCAMRFSRCILVSSCSLCCFDMFAPE